MGVSIAREDIDLTSLAVAFGGSIRVAVPREAPDPTIVPVEMEKDGPKDFFTVASGDLIAAAVASDPEDDDGTAVPFTTAGGCNSVGGVPAVAAKPNFVPKAFV
jgi:hypothetical protein